MGFCLLRVTEFSKEFTNGLRGFKCVIKAFVPTKHEDLEVHIFASETGVNTCVVKFNSIKLRDIIENHSKSVCVV